MTARPRQRARLSDPRLARFLPTSPRTALPAVLALAAGLLTASPAAIAGIAFENCVQGSDGSISCDTRPTGNTYLNDKDAQYGLLQQASPGWSEFDPYQGFNQDLGGGED